MVIVRLMGGLGNQMFQYATAYAVSKSINAPLYIDKTFLEQKNITKEYTLRDYELWKLNVNPKFITKKQIVFLKLKSRLRSLLGFGFNLLPSIIYYTDEDFNKLFNLNPLKNEVICLTGYWQSEELIKSIRGEILNQFSLSQQLDNFNVELVNNITSENSVSIHIRRGDYISNISANQFHGLCSINYYYTAIEMIIKSVENPSFYFFSDDMEWVKKEFKIADCYKVIYVDHNQNDNHFDLLLMAKCKHNIIANSSFSWWGAWLNQNNEKIVIAPQKWFALDNDMNNKIILHNWIKID